MCFYNEIIKGFLLTTKYHTFFYVSHVSQSFFCHKKCVTFNKKLV